MTNPVPEMAKYPHDMPVVLTYGGGTNSSAILVELIKRGYPAPNLIVFADTGAERPQTYSHISRMSMYAVDNGYPEILIVKNTQPSKMGGLYEMCMHYGRLPAVAYGFKSCSYQYKIEPVRKLIEERFGKKTPYLKIVGYDAGEERRVDNAKGKETEFQTNWYPLIEWGMDRDACIESLRESGIPLAGKSSCFMCPNSRQQEVRDLVRQYPEYKIKIVDLEKRAWDASLADGITPAAVGLGRSWRWTDMLANGDLFDAPDIDKPMPCGCYDGDDEP
jgi:hypothetical protein